MADLNDLIEDSNAKLSRRNVVVGTAWAVPAIMAVGAAPAMATTGGATASVSIETKAKKLSVTITIPGWNTKTTSVTITQVRSGVTDMEFNGQTPINRNFEVSGANTVIIGNFSDAASTPPKTWTITYVITQTLPTVITTHYKTFSW